VRITFDKKADAISLIFREGRISKDVPISENVFAGYDRKGELIEVQILDASEIEQPWLSLEAAAKIIGKSTRTLLRWIEAGEINPPKVGREYRFSPQLLQSLGPKAEESENRPRRRQHKRR
jgi:excisionase family DNA binding protein